MTEADTLSVDTLEAASQDMVALDLISFDSCGVFSDDTLLHAEVPYRPYGFGSQATPFRLRSDAWSGLLLLVCLLLAASLVLRLRRQFRELLQSVFFPIPGKKEEPLVDDPLRYSTRLVAVTLLSLTAATVTFTYTQHDVGFYAFAETPYLVFAAFFLLWLAYFLAKRLLSGFVNWVFFRKEKIFTWKRATTFLYVAESLLFLVLSLLVAYLPFSPEEVFLFVICLVFFVKLLLLFKTFKIFFPKMYGTLHLIVYFCTLELMPLLVMTQVLTYAEAVSMVKL